LREPTSKERGRGKVKRDGMKRGKKAKRRGREGRRDGREGTMPPQIF